MNAPEAIPSLRPHWNNRPYYSLDSYFKQLFGHKCYKIALNAHMSCPNRDGTLGNRGCIFCSAGGSGEYAVSLKEASVEEQLRNGIALFGNKNIGSHYVAYFHA